MFVDLKECVEYVMLVDFGCNDFGCVVVFGLVWVDSFMQVEYYVCVMYIVLNVVVKVGLVLLVFDVFFVCFLVGMFLGVLKICVMEIFDEFEFEVCGFYGGVIGYLLFSGDLDICIMICIFVVEFG